LRIMQLMSYLVYGVEPAAPKEAPLSEWAIDHDPNLDDEARAYLRHALGYVKRKQGGSPGDMSAH
jgi:hypothetical protein